MNIQTTRFGELELDKKDILNFKEGLLGFDTLTKFFVVDPGDQTLILWLQSVDDPKTAFPIIEPKIFNPSYSLKLLPSELNSLALESVNQASVYTILTIPKDVTEMSANLKAPVIINNATREARQIVLQDSKLEVRHEMYKDLKRYIVSFTGDDSNRTTVNEIIKEGPSVQSLPSSNKTENTENNQEERKSEQRV